MSASRPSLSDLARFTFASATLVALAWFAFQLVSIALRLGSRPAIRSAAGIALPLLAATYGYVSGRHSLRRVRALPLAARFAIGLVLGGLALGSVPWFLALQPIPASEILITSSIAVLALAFASDARGSMALYAGAASGMILYVAVHGMPRVV